MSFNSRFNNMKVTDEPVYKSELTAGTTENVLIASTQWERTLPASVPLIPGDLANGFTFFDNVADKNANGTTPYYEFNIAYGLSVQLSGSTGSATLTLDGVAYNVPFATTPATLEQTAIDFVNTNQSAINASGFQVFAITNSIGTFLRFGSPTDTELNAIIFANVSGTLSGTLVQEFVGGSVAVGDHLVIQYVGTPVENLRLLHIIRATFNIQLGSTQFAGLGLYRWANDSLVGSEQLVIRQNDVTGTQTVLETFTANATDAFVIGGFYLALNNGTSSTLTFDGDVGILIQTIFQKPATF